MISKKLKPRYPTSGSRAGRAGLPHAIGGYSVAHRFLRRETGTVRMAGLPGDPRFPKRGGTGNEDGGNGCYGLPDGGGDTRRKERTASD